MLWKYAGSICSFGKCIQNNIPMIADHIRSSNINLQQVRYIKKHWNPKFKKLRREKVFKPEKWVLEQKSKMFENPTEESIRSVFKRHNIIPQHPWSESTIYYGCLGQISEPYEPPQGDGKISLLNKEGALKQLENMQTKGKGFFNIRKIKSFDEKFDTKVFPEEALQVYIKAHEVLASGKTEDLIQYVTENTYTLMTNNIKNKTIRWKFLGSLEQPVVVHTSLAYLFEKTQVYAQVTARFHTEQQLVVYDRFGRLMQGSEILRKDVLEYVVFEKYLPDKSAPWRIAGKIKPKIAPPMERLEKTYVSTPKKEEVQGKKDEVCSTN